MIQSRKRKERNAPIRSELKTVEKKALKLIEDKKIDEAVKYMPRAYKMIDTACKKHLVQKNTASRKKSKLARALNKVTGKAAV